MVVIRLTRVGKKNSPAYRVVVAEKRRAVKRKFIEIIGHYNPTLNPKEIVINKDRAIFWMNLGAQPSPTVRNLMADLGVIPKKDKINIKYARSKKKKEEKEEKPAVPTSQSESESRPESVGKDTSASGNQEDATREIPEESADIAESNEEIGEEKPNEQEESKLSSESTPEDDKVGKKAKVQK